MIRLSTALAIAAVTALAACQSETPTGFCAAIGDPEARIEAYAGDGAGRLVYLLSDAATGETQVTLAALDAPLAETLWEDAQHTFQSTQRGELSPCDGAVMSFASFGFGADDAQERQTLCDGNALARLVERMVEASAEALPGDVPVEGRFAELPDSAAMACEWANDRL